MTDGGHATVGFGNPLNSALGSCDYGWMFEVRRPSDGELCGFVDEINGLWRSLAVFGGLLATYPDEAQATEHVLSVGLSSLAERWWFRNSPASEWQVVCIQEASPNSVRLALDYYSSPGVPTVTITRDQLSASVELSLLPY